MERRFRVRLDELLDDAEVPPGLLRGVLPRLQDFLQPFVAALHTPEQQTNAHHYVQGLLSDLDSKDVESIAYLHDRERQGLQKFIGQADWDHQPLLAELARQVGTELGEADGVLVFDPSAFPKKGTESVGVQRQWCGRLGKLDNCQVGIYLGYVSSREHALVDFRLYLPKEWAHRKKRRQKAGVPQAVRFRTRHELALAMLDERPWLPHAWVSGDDEMGRCAWFREQLRSRGESYLLAVPSNTAVRDLRGARAAVRRPRPSAAGSVHAGGPLVRGPAGGGLGDGGCPRRRERAAGGPGHADAGAGTDRGTAIGRGGVAGGVPRAARGRHLEARLPAVERAAGHAGGGVCPRVQGTTADRRMSEAGQGRSGLGRLPSADLGGLAPSSNLILTGDLVPDAGNQAGKKSGPPR